MRFTGQLANAADIPWKTVVIKLERHVQVMIGFLGNARPFSRCRGVSIFDGLESDTGATPVSVIDAAKTRKEVNMRKVQTLLVIAGFLFSLAANAGEKQVSKEMNKIKPLPRDLEIQLSLSAMDVRPPEAGKDHPFAGVAAGLLSLPQFL